MNFGKKAILAVFWSTFGNYLGFGINFISQLILVRILFPEDFGVVALAVSIFEILSILTSWSFSIAVIQMPEEEDLIDTAFYMAVFSGVVLLFLTLLISSGLHFYYPGLKILPKVFIFIGLARAVSFVSAIYAAYLEKKLKYKTLSIMRSFINIVSVIAAVLSAISGFGVWALVIKEILSAFLSLIVFKIISGWTFTWKFNRRLAKKIFHLSGKMLLSRGLEGAFYRIDSFLLGLLGGINVLGYYSQARYLVDVSNAISTPGTAVAALPVYATLQDDENKLKQTSRIFNYFLVRLMLPVSLMFLLFSNEIVLILFGEKWLSASIPLKGLFLYPLLVPVFENLKTLLYGIGKIGTVAWIRFLQILCAVPLLIFGFKYFNVLGLSCSFILSIGIGLLFIYFYSRKYIAKTVQENLLFPFISALIAFLCIFYLKKNFFLGMDMPGFFVLGILTVILYVGIVFLTEFKLIRENIKLITRQLDTGKN